jgi:hypothetical protein
MANIAKYIACATLQRHHTSTAWQDQSYILATILTVSQSLDDALDTLILSDVTWYTNNNTMQYFAPGLGFLSDGESHVQSGPGLMAVA